IQSLSERAAEAYEIELLTYEYTLIAEFEIDIAKADLDAVKEKLSKIGNVNFMALDEYDTQSERMKFYDEQINDLEISEKNLSETIDEINQTAEGKFRETFDQVHKNFKELFVTLFSNEGYAELSLSDGDPLEADIEITAKPPGKKPHSIEGLSGGEKTLTAIALLFAIYLVKPAPFCILDEVDAPLDDTNVGRFITLIRKFSDNTQFLLVTHNKKTMEACDSLYGITQQDEGVSKVVSVRLTSSSNS
ncbi:MAG: AAA family ATPase, partial [Chlorobi bacterium]|nr:AAA family ATPase [Chlorobiota bacterium]